METESPRSTQVEALKGLAPWLGGKRQLGKMLARRIGEIPHTCYAEPFVGMGGVFFRRRRRSPVEAVNDAQNEVVNLFRIVQRHPQALADTLGLCLGARAEFMNFRWQDFWRLTDVERAARFYFLMQCGFRGRVKNPGFGSSPSHASGWDLGRLKRRLVATHRRLAGVCIENLGYADFIDLYDTAETLFYLDPPYYGHEGDYGKELFSRADFQRLARRLARIRGRFIFSINDAPEIRELFRWAAIETVSVTWDHQREARHRTGDREPRPRPDRRRRAVRPRAGRARRGAGAAARDLRAAAGGAGAAADRLLVPAPGAAAALTSLLEQRVDGRGRDRAREPVVPGRQRQVRAGVDLRRQTLDDVAQRRRSK